MADLADWEKAYAAGLFDGEGCVVLYMRPSGSAKKDHSLRASLNVTNGDIRPLTWLQERYAGSIRIWTNKGNRKPIAAWRVYSNQADVFAYDIRPYLQIKGAELDLWMEARKLVYGRGHNHGLPEDEVAARRALVSRVKELKAVRHLG